MGFYFDTNSISPTKGSGGGGTGGDTISAINNTGAAITSGDKVFIAPLATPQSGANYELIKPKIATNPFFGFLSVYTPQYTGYLTVDLTSKYVSGFSTYNYCTVPLVFDYSQPWEFTTSFSLTSTNGVQFLLFSDGSSYDESGLIIYISDGNMGVQMYYDDNGTQTELHDFDNAIPSLSANTTYYLKTGWTGTEYYVKYSTDGTTWIENESRYSSQETVSQTVNAMRLGARYNRDQSLSGKIYMDKTYMTSGDTIQWQMYSDGASNLGSDILTGTASDSIASGSVGEVVTVLGQ